MRRGGRAPGRRGHRHRAWSRCRRGTASSGSPRPTRRSVLPPGVPVLSVEAAATFGWARWADDSIGIDRFGEQRARRRRPGQAGHQRGPCGGPGAEPWSSTTTREGPDGAPDPAVRGAGPEPLARQPDPRLHHVRPAGQLRDGGIRGLTSNPTIFQKAIEGSPQYDEQFRALARDDAAIIDDYWALVLQDITGALEVFAPLYESLGRRRRLRERRGRPRPGPRHGRDHGGRPPPQRDDRPAEPAREDPRRPPKGCRPSSR